MDNLDKIGKTFHAEVITLIIPESTPILQTYSKKKRKKDFAKILFPLTTK